MKILFSWLLVVSSFHLAWSQSPDPTLWSDSTVRIPASATQGDEDTSVKVLDSIVGISYEAAQEYVYSRNHYAYGPDGRRNLWINFEYESTIPPTILLGQRLVSEFLPDLEIVTSEFWQAGAWQNLLRQTDSLDVLGRTTSLLIERASFDNGEWVPFRYQNNRYEGNTDRLLARALWLWNDGHWERTDRWENTYDADGLRTKEERHRWNTDTQIWEPYRETYHTYDELQQLTASLHYEWNTDTVDWYLRSEAYAAYNGDTQLDSAWWFTRPLDQALAGGKNCYTYAGNNVIIDTTYVLNEGSGEWYRQRYARLEYDGDGDLRTVKNFRYAPNDDQAFLLNVDEYFYAGIGVATRSPQVHSAWQCQLANPHPGPQTVTCSTASEPVRDIVARVYDLQGRLHWSRPLQAQGRDWSVELDPDLPRGLYLLVWESSEGILGQEKLLLP